MATAILGVVVCLLSLSPTANGLAALIESEWSLDWEEDFTGVALNTSLWNVMDGPGISANNELQYYSPKNVFVSNGSLHISSIRESLNGFNYTSGRVDTKGTWARSEGRFEIRGSSLKFF
jgi:beta-glucanase (GH16 family)